jgi:hypothetical protein
MQRSIRTATTILLVAAPIAVMLVVGYISHRLDERFERERAMVHSVEARHLRLSEQQLNEMQADMDR